jgi:hypothetical protein
LTPFLSPWPFITNLGEYHHDINRFKLALRDFLIQLKEFLGDNAELFLEEKEAEQQQKAGRARRGNARWGHAQTIASQTKTSLLASIFCVILSSPVPRFIFSCKSSHPIIATPKSTTPL